jgi:Cu-processing system permease protein
VTDGVARSVLPDVRAILALAQKEFLDSVRSKWILVMAGLFIALTLVFSYFGAASAGGSAGFQGFRSTAGGMVATVSLFLPIMSLMLAYATIAGEREQGSLQLLLSYPITRMEMVIGKVAGLGAIAGVAILAGLGVSGIIVAAAAGTAYWEAFLVFVGGSILFALAFVSVGVFFSSLTKKRSAALGVAIFLWFFFFLIYQLIIIGLFIAAGGSLAPPSPGGESTMPDWVFVALMVSPGQAFQLLSQLAFADPGPTGLPGFINMGSTVLVLIAWIVIPAALAVLGFRRKDL